MDNEWTWTSKGGDDDNDDDFGAKTERLAERMPDEVIRGFELAHLGGRSVGRSVDVGGLI